jgi:hypothetical protein
VTSRALSGNPEATLVFKPTPFDPLKTADFDVDSKRVKGAVFPPLLSHQGRVLVEAAVFFDSVDPFLVFLRREQMHIAFRDQTASLVEGIDEFRR